VVHCRQQRSVTHSIDSSRSRSPFTLSKKIYKKRSCHLPNLFIFTKSIYFHSGCVNYFCRATPKISSKLASFLRKEEAPFWLPEQAFCFARNPPNIRRRIGTPPNPNLIRSLARFNQWRASAEAKTREPAIFLVLPSLSLSLRVFFCSSVLMIVFSAAQPLINGCSTRPPLTSPAECAVPCPLLYS
jgi:hypothetical protein